LAQTPSLAYPEIMKSGALQLIIGLLSHENIDVVIDAIELINELTDDDSIQEEEEEDGVSSMEHIKALLKELVWHRTYVNRAF
jgi:beta-catenin-like protein 1